MPLPLTSCQEEPPLRTHSWDRRGAGRIKCQLVLVCFPFASAESCVQRMLRVKLSTGTKTLVGRCLGWRRDEYGEQERQHVSRAYVEPYLCVMPLSGVRVQLWDGGRLNLRFNHIPLHVCCSPKPLTCHVCTTQLKSDLYGTGMS